MLGPQVLWSYDKLVPDIKQGQPGDLMKHSQGLTVTIQSLFSAVTSSCPQNSSKHWPAVTMVALHFVEIYEVQYKNTVNV